MRLDVDYDRVCGRSRGLSDSPDDVVFLDPLHLQSLGQAFGNYVQLRGGIEQRSSPQGVFRRIDDLHERRLQQNG